MINDQGLKFFSVEVDKPTSTSFWGNDVIKLKLVIKIILASCVYVSHVLDLYDVILYMIELCC